MFKVTIPAFTGPLDAASIMGWLNRCEDSYETWSALNADKVLKPELQIMLAGLHLEDETAARWWDENRADLKKLATWTEFSTCVKDRFVPSGWRLEALQNFFDASQNGSDFRTFVRDLQTARNALASAGAHFAISDSTFKNHLLFRADRILQLRVRAIPSFAFQTICVDSLINLMTTTYDSLLAENVIPSPALTPTTSPTYGSIPLPRAASSSHSSPILARNASAYPLADLTYAEREDLKAVGGCFHCRLTPKSPGWRTHYARDCPGDKSRGIPPRRRAPATIIATVMPSAVLGYGTESEFSDDYP